MTTATPVSQQTDKPPRKGSLSARRTLGQKQGDRPTLGPWGATDGQKHGSGCAQPAQRNERWGAAQKAVGCHKTRAKRLVTFL